MSENIKVAVSELHKLINIKNVIGEPIETEDKIIIPVMRMGVGFGAGVEPISMVLIPKKGNDSEGVRVLDLSKGTEKNKALSDLSLIISDLVKTYLGGSNDDVEYDESEYIEPEFTTKEEIEE